MYRGHAKAKKPGLSRLQAGLSLATLVGWGNDSLGSRAKFATILLVSVLFFTNLGKWVWKTACGKQFSTKTDRKCKI